MRHDCEYRILKFKPESAPFVMSFEGAYKISTHFNAILKCMQLGLKNMAAIDFDAPGGELVMYGVSEDKVRIEYGIFNPSRKTVVFGDFTTKDIEKWTGWTMKELGL